MTLHVPFESFAESVKRILRHRQAFVATHPRGSLCTAALPAERTVVAAVLEGVGVDEAKRRLAKDGLEVFDGSWLPAESAPSALPYIASVSYVSSEPTPGAWIDAFPSLPTSVQVLRVMYEEFRGTGELKEVSFEEFVRLANPTVVIASPSEIERYLQGKSEQALATGHPHPSMETPAHGHGPAEASSALRPQADPTQTDSPQDDLAESQPGEPVGTGEGDARA
jgi:hypothetical protein